MGFLHAVFFSLENLNPQLRLEILNIDYTQNLFAEVGIEAMEVPAGHEVQSADAGDLGADDKEELSTEREFEGGTGAAADELFLERGADASVRGSAAFGPADGRTASGGVCKRWVRKVALAAAEPEGVEVE